MLGLMRGTVKLEPYQAEWQKDAEDVILLLKRILGRSASDIQHIGSTSIPAIHAKPIIDIAVGVRTLKDIKPYIGRLKQHNIIFRGQDVPNQQLFVIGDLAKDVRTHHIHVVKIDGDAWNNYINFRDYLNAFPQKAEMYDKYKLKLAALFAEDRKHYTSGKKEIIDILLKEAKEWKKAKSSAAESGCRTIKA